MATEASSESFLSMAYNYLKSWISGRPEIPHDYPPRIMITLRLKSECSPSKATITVKGLNKKYQFHLYMRRLADKKLIFISLLSYNSDVTSNVTPSIQSDCSLSSGTYTSSYTYVSCCLISCMYGLVVSFFKA